MFKKVIKYKGKYRADGDKDRKRTELPLCECFRCRSVDNLISKYPKPPKYNEKQQKTVRFNERGIHAL